MGLPHITTQGGHGHGPIPSPHASARHAASVKHSFLFCVLTNCGASRRLDLQGSQGRISDSIDAGWLLGRQRSGQSSGRMKIRAFVGLINAMDRTEREGSDATRKLPGMPRADSLKCQSPSGNVSSVRGQGIIISMLSDAMPSRPARSAQARLTYSTRTPGEPRQSERRWSEPPRRLARPTLVAQRSRLCPRTR